MSEECKVLERVSVAGGYLVLYDSSGSLPSGSYYSICWGDGDSEDSVLEIENIIDFSVERMELWARSVFFCTVLHFQAGVPLMVCESDSE